MADSNKPQDLDALKVDLESLRQEVASLASSLRAAGMERYESTTDALEDEVAHQRERLRSMIGQARSRGSSAIADIENEISERPLGTLAAAFAFGFILSKLLDR